MSPVRCLHHLGMVVRNAGARLEFLTNKFGFSPLAECRGGGGKWVVSSGDAVFVVSERGGRGSPGRPDSVTDAALEVSDVAAVVERVARGGGGRVLTPPHFVEDARGRVEVARVASVVGDVEHTLVNTAGYRGGGGAFLPGFVSAVPDPSSPLSLPPSSVVDGVDHVTLVCEAGRGLDVARWYEDCFGMKRLMSNRLDDPVEGIRIEGEVGLRLRAMQYWKCAELGVAAPEPEPESETDSSGHSDSSPSPRQRSSRSLRLVIAESLWPRRGNPHVQRYLADHGGPGIQHVGLTTSDICASVRECLRRGVEFRRPPPAYYRLESKLREIARAGLDPAELSDLGVLIDSEADPRPPGSGSRGGDVDRFLLQIFSMPIFDEDTFFLEIIQRRGAEGFGEGNVTALAMSIDLENKRNKEEEEEKEKEETTRVNC